MTRWGALHGRPNGTKERGSDDGARADDGADGGGSRRWRRGRHSDVAVLAIGRGGRRCGLIRRGGAVDEGGLLKTEKMPMEVVGGAE